MSDPRDHLWLLARERGEDVDHVPAATRAGYHQLERLLAALPDPAPPTGWKARVLGALDTPAAPAPPRRNRRWVGVAGAFAAVIAVLVLYPRRSDHRPAPIAITGAPGPVVTSELRRGGGPRRGGDDDANVGDTLVLRADADRPIELRVYGDADEPLARCPGPQGCTIARDGSHGYYVLELTLRSPGVVRAMLFSGDSIPTVFRDLDADVAAGHERGVEVRELRVDHVQ